MKPVFAVDVGGVLASKQHDGQPMEGSIEGVKRLQEHFDVKIVSQCGLYRQRQTIKWLEEHFPNITLSDQYYIGFDQPNKNKVLKQIGATYLIDDRAKHILPACRIGVYGIHFGSPPLVPEYGSVYYTQIYHWSQIFAFSGGVNI